MPSRAELEGDDLLLILLTTDPHLRSKPEHTSPGLSEQPTASAQVKLVALVTINKIRQNNNRTKMHNNNIMITQSGTNNNSTSE